MLQVWVQDSMTRIFPDQKPPENSKKNIKIYVAHNEAGSFQVGISGPPEGLNDLHVEASEMVSDAGARIPKESIDVLYAEYVPVPWQSANNTPDDLEGQVPGFFPDPLLPTLWRGVGWVQFPGTVSSWIRVRINESIPAGIYRGNVGITCKAGQGSVQVEMHVWPFSLPKRSHFLMTNWLFPGLIIKFHKLEPLTERFWQVIERYARNLSDHRQNVILTPLFQINGNMNTQLLDGRLQGQLIDIVETEYGKYTFDFHNFDKWVQLFLKYGFEGIEGSHLAIPGSRHPSDILFRKPSWNHAGQCSFASTTDPDYRNFLKQFLTSLRLHLERNGWLKKFYLHLSDEPHGDQFEPYSSLSKFVRSVAPEIRLMDAMVQTEFAPYVDYPVPTGEAYERFVKSSDIPKERIWFYYACSDCGLWPNRFIDYHLIRVRIFTWLAFRYNIPGFLHWGLNYWNWHSPDRFEMEYNPYDNTTGGGLPAGDGYVLYPPQMASKSDDPVDSIRWEIIRKAMEDYEYLYILKDLSASGNKQAKALIEELEEKIAPSFTKYTRDHDYLENFRLRMGQTIAAAI